MYKNNLFLNVVFIACFLFGNAKSANADDLPEWKCLYDREYITSDKGPESPVNIGQLQPGAKFPDLQGWTSEDKAVDLLKIIAKKPTVISFYKSAYCGHCQWQFTQLMAAKDELNKLGFKLMAISHIKKDGIKRMEGRYKPPFPLYSDKDQVVGKALGFAFSKESPEVNMYPGRNDMGVYGSALYIVNTNGTILYEWTYSDNKVRLSSENVIAAAKQVLTNEKIVFTKLKKAIKTPDKVVNLNLSYQELNSIPIEIFNFPNLKVLRLTGNKISEIPAGIAKLTKLERLELSHNKINQLPPEIGLLKELKDLQLLDNNLKSLPPEIGKLKNLVRLNLMYNPLEVLPPEIGNLNNLLYLRLYGHHLNKLPPEIGKLKNLKNLVLIGDKTVTKITEPEEYAHYVSLQQEGTVIGLKILPPEIGNLENLFELHLLYNELKTLPPEIGNLKNLKFIHLAENQLVTLPAEFAKLDLAKYSGCEGLYLWKNKFKTIPPEIGAMNLVYLYLDYNPIESLPETFYKNPHFRRVYVNHTNLKKISTIENPSLYDISFRYNKFTSIPKVKGKKGFNSFDLTGNQITKVDDFSDREIRRLILNNNQITNVSVFPENVIRLELKGNPISSENKQKIQTEWNKKRKPKDLKFK